jgi:hypothetical protein
MPRRIILGGLTAVLLLAGCGEQKKNEARAPNPVQTTVRVTDAKVTVSPDTFNFAEAAGLKQHQSAPEAEAEQRGETISTPTQTEPPTEMDQPVELAIINLSNQPMNLEVTGPGADATSKDIPARGTGLLKVTLGTGTYKVVARGDFRPKPAKLKIGPLRHSAQGDLLLP